MTAVRWAERAGRSTSEDRIFVGDRTVVVLDGASQPDRAAHDGGWYASVLGAEVHEYLQAYPDVLLVEVVAAAIGAVAARYDLLPGASPSATLSIVRWSDLAVEVFVLGDSPVVVVRRDGQLDAVRDDRLALVAESERRAFRAAVASHGFKVDHTREWRALVDAQRLARNRPGGYWIAEANPDAAHNARLGVWPVADVSGVLVVTDGVAAGPDKYTIPATWAAAVEMARRDPMALIDAVHAAEDSDPDGRRWPRSKRHDDKTTAFISLAPHLTTDARVTAG